MPGCLSLRSVINKGFSRPTAQPSTTTSQSLVQPDPHILCKFCAGLDLDIQDFKGARNPDYRATFQKIVLPPICIIRSQGCKFCTFIVSAAIGNSTTSPQSLDPSLDDIQLSLEWIKDGRKLENSGPASPSTRRLRISAGDDASRDAYLILMSPEGSDEQFLGRRVDPSSIDIPKLRRWLADCRNGHASCNDTLGPSGIERLSSNPSFRLIDVERGCLVSAKNAPFFALSYVWGTSNIFRAMQKNIESLMRPGALHAIASEVPLTIKDAMHLTQLLGYRYLWVDSICIVQDNSEDLTRILTIMDAIYALATLTICAAGKDAGAGIHGLTSGSRELHQEIIQYNEDIQLMVTRPAEHFVERSTWNTRAWTFQERICSRRCLIFVEDRAFYQCRKSVMCEDIRMEDNASLVDTQLWSLEAKDALGRLFSENPVRQYTKCVQLYTQRRLTFASDKLAAFSAIEMLLSQSMNTDFRVGLPTSYFDFALLWTPNKLHETGSHRVHEFPSWTWVGWGGASEYSYSVLEGVLVNMHEWFSSRTWIEWHIVTPSQDRMLLWDGRKPGLAGRWKGYAPPNSSSSYGRTIPSDIKGPDRSNQLLCETSGTVNWDPYDERNQPVKLGFCTHSSFFAMDLIPQSKPLTREFQDSPYWYSLFDADGDWCGTVSLDPTWVDQGEAALRDRPEKFSYAESSIDKPARKTFEFIAISEARDFSAAEHDSWTYYVPMDRVDSQWDLYYVLLIVTDEEGRTERRGLGKVFKEAFKKSHQPGYAWKEILLG